jgi:hypothetical protein
MSQAEQIFALRQRYWQRGYRPLEIWGPDQRVNDKGEPLRTPGKQPRGRWREDASRDPPEAVRIFPDRRALNTGLLCGDAVAFDIDILDQQLADQIVILIETTVGRTPLVRIGRPPKILLVYRPEHSFNKMQTPEMFFSDGTKAKIELLAEGQQFVADGVHPDTGKPYGWTDRSPAEVPLAELPIVTEEQARAIFTEAKLLLRLYGGEEKKNKARHQRRKPTGSAGDFFYQVNTAALTDIAAWARSLCPLARFEPGTGGWRISSKDLGRDLEEDISIHFKGIRDWGEEESLSAIDLVMRWGGKGTALDAALWLCERLGIDPIDLGYEAKPNRGSQSSAAQNTEAGVSLDDFYAYMPTHNYIFVPSLQLWPAASVNARIAPIPLFDATGAPVLDEEGKPKKLRASAWLDRNKPVEQTTWAPGLSTMIEGRLTSEGGWIEREGVSCFNLYRPAPVISGDPRKAGRWIDHVNHVYPEDAEHIIRWVAHRVQRPAEKINHALVLGGSPNIGKDSLLEPVKRAIGAWNWQDISPRDLLGRFNGFAKSVILRVNEARDLGDINRFQFYDHMKVYTAAPPDVLRVDEKNIREYYVPNCCGVIGTTNYKTDGMYFPADDRRHYVAWSFLAKENFGQSYWDELWAWYENGGDQHVAAYLAQLDITGFNPKAPPPKTPAFWDIVNSYRPSEDAELADLLDLVGNPEVVTLAMLLVKASEEFAAWLKERKNRRIILHRFEACGYVAVRNEDASDGLWKVRGRRQAIYGKADLSLRDRLIAASELVSRSV